MIFEEYGDMIYVTFVTVLLISLSFGVLGVTKGSSDFSVLGNNDYYTENGNTTYNITGCSRFTIVDLSFYYDFNYTVVNDGSDNEFVKEHVWKEQIKYVIEKVDSYNDSDDEGFEFEFGMEYFDSDVADLLNDGSVWSNVLIRVETSEEEGYLYADEFDGVDYSILRDTFIISSEDDVEEIMIYLNPNTLYRLDVFYL